MKSLLFKLFVTLLFCSVTIPLSAQFSGSGSGTADDPYRIYNAVQLNQVRNFLNEEDVYFSLEADIDMTDWIAENNPVQGWQPIGNSSSAFKGVFNGNGHIISNLWINRPDTDYIGLFGYVSDGNVYDLNLTNSNIEGGSSVGGIVGMCYNNKVESKISDCFFQGVIKGNYCGGIIGKYYIDSSNNVNEVYVSGCFTDCDIYSSYAGGIVGEGTIVQARLHIDNCVSICRMHGSNKIGGIIGSVYGGSTSSVYNGVTVSECYAHIIALSCSTSIGGIVGICNTDNRHSRNYSTGIITGKEAIGGLAGEGSGGFVYSYSQLQKISGENTVAGLFNGGKINYSVAINNVIETTNGDALARVGLGSGSSSNNLAWTLTTMIANGEKLPIPTDDAKNGTSTGLSTLKLQATYEGLGWDFNDFWKIEETESFPYFQWQTAPPYFSQILKKGDTHLSGQCMEQGTVTVRVGYKRYTTQSAGNAWSVDLEEPLAAGDMVEVWVQADDKMPSYVVCATAGLSGSGTETDPYLITSAEDLQAISGITDENPYYRLTADIYLADYIAENGWTPVVLTGNFDGQGHTVSGLQCEATTLGLFNTLMEGKEIKDLKVVIADNGMVKGSSLTGGLVASNKGSIVNCSVSGTVEGEETAGGVAGENSGTITNCSVSGSVSGGTSTGGIAGTNSGTITDCSISGNISGGTSTGGIAGSNTGSISECYTKGNVSSSGRSAHDAGGIVGENSAGGKISDCYSDAVTSGSYIRVAGIAGFNYGTIEHCYAYGDVSGYNVAGVCGYNFGAAAELKGCVAANSNLSGSNQALRVLGGFSSDATSPGLTDNYAVSDMVVSVNGVPQTIYDDPLNGTAMPETELMKQATYEALGWNFTDVWKIDEGTSYPYLPQFAVYVSGITLDKTEAELMRGETLRLSATVSPDDARNKTVKWTSGNDKIATVDADGVVAAIAVGETTITATAADGSGISATCKIKVTPRLVTSIELGKEELTLEKTFTAQLVATVLPEDADDRNVVWSSGNEEVATVDETGLITALKVGEASITATANDGSGVTATCVVTVTPKLAESISLNETELTLERTATAQLTATVLPETADDRSVTWSSGNTAVAKVDEYGMVTAVGLGETVITAITDDGTDLTATCFVKVTPKLVKSLSLSETELSIENGSSAQLTAIISPQDADDGSVAWTSNNTMAATVDATGQVTATGVGTAVITVSTNDGSNFSATCTVTVTPKEVAHISFDKTTLTLYVNESSQITATVLPDDADDRRLIWSSGDVDIARVSSNGEVTAVGVGETEITATANDGSGVSAVCRVTVLPIMVTSIILDRESLELFDNSSFQLTATVLPYTATDRTVTWQSSNDRVASVNADGTIYVWDVGETDIIATANDGSGVSATCHLTVIPVMMESITLDKEYLEIQDGDRVKLIVTALEPYDVSDSSLTWTSSDENVATVYNGSSNGCYILAEGVGETDIIASANDGSGVSATCRVTVTPVKVSEVLLGKTELVMVKGQSEKLIPTVWPDNASDKSLTWTSSDESVVTVDNDGSVEAVNAGEADVTATTNDGTNLKATCHVTVIDSDGGVYTIGADGISVLIKDGRIVVVGKDDDEIVTVHTLEGKLVYRGTDNAVDVYSNVFYLVTVRGTTYKVFIP